MKTSQVDINETITTLKGNVQSMVAMLDILYEKNEVLENQLDVLKKQNKQLTEKSEELQNVTFGKKIEDSLSSSSEQKNEIRQQLDFLIKEIDECIKYFSR